VAGAIVDYQKAKCAIALFRFIAAVVLCYCRYAIRECSSSLMAGLRFETVQAASLKSSLDEGRSLRMQTMITIASRQVWPQILMTYHCQPRRLVVLHTSALEESEGPARKLKQFFDDHTDAFAMESVILQEIPANDYLAIRRCLDGCDDGAAELNITGGTKLMVLAAYDWARAKGRAAHYLDRGSGFITSLDFSEGEALLNTHPLDESSLDFIDPVDLVRCQVWADDVLRAGELLMLNERGREASGKQIRDLSQSETDPRDFLEIVNDGNREDQRGDRLEYLAALCILKLGIPMVTKGMMLNVSRGSNQPHAEIDLVFQKQGMLWVVDCKDKQSHSRYEKKIRQAMKDDRETAGRICSLLKISGIKTMKDDLLSGRVLGGLNARIICVRQTEFNEVEQQYAGANGIAIALKKRLLDDLAAILDVDPAGLA
jgi:hypothetical protein